MFPYGVVLFAIALFACERVQAVPIEMKRIARDECDICNQFDRDVFGLDEKRGFARPLPILSTLREREAFEPVKVAALPQYQAPRQVLLPFDDWRNLSILLRPTHLRDFPHWFRPPIRETPTRPTPVPEPGTIALLLLGLGTTLLMRGRVKAAANALVPR